MIQKTIIYQDDSYNATITLDSNEVNIPNEDFVIEYEISEDELTQPKLIITQHPQYGDYAFCYSCNPNYFLNQKNQAPFDENFQGNFIFCIDRSRSMWGEKIEMAKKIFFILLEISSWYFQ